MESRYKVHFDYVHQLYLKNLIYADYFGIFVRMIEDAKDSSGGLIGIFPLGDLRGNLLAESDVSPLFSRHTDSFDHIFACFQSYGLIQVTYGYSNNQKNYKKEYHGRTIEIRIKLPFEPIVPVEDIGQ